MSYPKEYEIYSDYTELWEGSLCNKGVLWTVPFFQYKQYIIDDIGIEYAADVY